MSELIKKASEYSFTENGALTYNTSADDVLNLFALGGALRYAEDKRILDIVKKAWNENRKDTLATLLYIRDIRGGLGEKKVFRLANRFIADELIKSEKFNGYNCLTPLFDAIVEVGSWKDIVATFSVAEYFLYVKKHMEDKNSLMAKWLPSIGGSKNKDAEYLAYMLGMTPKEYRKWLSAKRRTLDLVETKLCDKDWNNINYSHVPSQANLLYSATFKRHDGIRYNNYIQSILDTKKDSKMNAATLAPYQITSKLLKDYETIISEQEAKPYQAMWNSLPDYTKGEDAIVVADVSGSMYGTPMCVSTSLAIYFAERNKGIFRNEYITFSTTPSFTVFKEGSSLRDKVEAMYRDDNWGFSTDLYKVFELILKTAVSHSILAEEMPKTLYIISDMEFDTACDPRGAEGDETLNTVFESIQKLYATTKYSVPTLVFWNVNSHQNNLPVQKDERGTVLVSGCSPSVFEQAISMEVNPLKYMYDVIHKERYTNLVEKISENL